MCMFCFTEAGRLFNSKMSVWIGGTCVVHGSVPLRLTVSACLQRGDVRRTRA